VLGATLLSCALLSPVTLLAQGPQGDHHDDHNYHDKKHKDDHQWNDHEDRAYKMYQDQIHRKSVAFDHLNDRDQQRYWAWRHNHSDSLLKIDIR